MCKRVLAFIICMLLPLSALGEELFIEPFNSNRMEIASNRHAQPDKSPQIVESFLNTEGFEMIAQTDEAELWLSQAYHTLRLVNRATGYVWGAIPLEDAQDLNKSWKSYAASIVAIECYDDKHTEKRYGMADNAQAEYTLTDNGFTCAVDFTELGISMKVEAQLTGDRLTLRLAKNSFAENGDYRCKSLAFLPFLGGVHGDAIEGWFLLPDGPGALMRFAAPGNYVAGFDKKVFGKDLGIDGLLEAQSIGANRPDDYLIADAQVLMPVYGIAHGIGQNGLLCVIEDGYEYVSIAATPAGLGNMKYNSIMARFEYRQKFSRASNRQGAGTLVPQEDANVLTPAVSFQLLHGREADYDGMALNYKQRLLDDGILRPKQAPDTMPLALTVLGEDVMQMSLWKSHKVFTTLEEANEILDDLLGRGIENITLLYARYTNNNMPGGALSRRLGTMEALARLKETAEQAGGRLELALDPMQANRDQINLRLQAANNMGTTPIVFVRNNMDLVYRETYFYRPNLVAENVEKARQAYEGYAFAVDQLGSRLYGDFTSGHSSTRRENTTLFLSLLAALDEGEGLSLYTPNELAWPRTRAFYDMPLVNGQYLYETDTVPFLPIVLSGTMEVYAPSLNTGAFSQDRILRMIEYGAYPSFVTTYAQSVELTNTPVADLFSTCYFDWADYIVETYDYMKTALNASAGRAMISHRAIDHGRIMVTYEGNVILYINYTDSPWQIGTDIIAPHDYMVKGG